MGKAAANDEAEKLMSFLELVIGRVNSRVGVLDICRQDEVEWMVAEEHEALSHDGTLLRYSRIGAGPALIFIHGSIDTSASWLEVAQLLSRQVMSYLYDRRNHGENYSLQKEVEDVDAILNVAGSEATLFGHSYGAIIALQAAMQKQPSRLVLYDPPLPVGGAVARSQLNEFKSLIDVGALDEALAFGLTHFVGLDPTMVATMRRKTNWSMLTKQARGWLQEIQEVEALGPSLTRYVGLKSKTLILVGTESADHPLKDAAQTLAATLSDAQISWLQGQGHRAHKLAPRMVADMVGRFLR